LESPVVSAKDAWEFAQWYDHRAQVESVRRLIETIDGLRKWGREK
jgi:hypothetical protein